MAIKIAFANWKGGVGKTTATQALGTMASIIGEKYIELDTDAQANSTSARGYNPESLQHNLYSLMLGESTLEQTILSTYYDPKSGRFFDPRDTKKMNDLGLKDLSEARRGPDLLPGGFRSSNADTDLANVPNWTKYLQKVVQKIEHKYDGIIYDTNPSLGKMTVSALVNADLLVIPTTAETWSLIGMRKLASIVVDSYELNPNLRIAGLLFSRIGYNNSSHEEAMKLVVEEVVPQLNKRLQEKFLSLDFEGDCPLKVKIFDSFVYESALISSAVSANSNVILAKPRDKKYNLSYSSSALAYWVFYAQLLSMVGNQQKKIKKIIDLAGYLKSAYDDQKEKRKK